jgi:hypothetical protein
MCVEKFPGLTKQATFNICESEQYVDCQIYQICTSDFNCEYINPCVDQYLENLPKFIMTLFMDEEAIKDMTRVLMKYCLSPKNSKICAKYQLYSKGERPSMNILPDGRKINPIDILFKKNLIVHTPE